MKRALLLIDIQKDFCKGGTLEVPYGDEVVPVANEMIKLFTATNDLVIATQDWHPANHGSFAANHDGKKVFDLIDLNGLKQVLWPTHCVENTTGSEFHDDLLPIPVVFCKGEDPSVDSYSGFFDNGKRNKTQLDDYLKEQGVTELFIMGLATDYCVKFTALDAVELGYKVNIISEGCQGVNLNNNDVGNAMVEMTKNGVIITHCDKVAKILGFEN
jgi:nicotinamidase/pyrazinamidase